jgi:hypothetical protein
MPTTIDHDTKDEAIERRKPRRYPNGVDPDADTDEMEQVSIEELNQRAEEERRKHGSGE